MNSYELGRQIGASCKDVANIREYADNKYKELIAQITLYHKDIAAMMLRYHDGFLVGAGLATEQETKG